MDFPPQPRRPRPALTLPDQQHQQQQIATPQPVASTSGPASPPSNLPGHLSPPSSARDDEDDITRELARLESLRLNVKQNLTLRPLKSSPGAAPSSAGGGQGTLSLNSASSVNLDSHPPTAIRRTFQGLPLNLKSDSLASNGLTDSSGDTASTGTMSTPQSPSEEGSPILYTAISPSSASHINALPLPPSLHSPSDIISHYADNDESPASPFRHDPPPLSPAAVASSSSANAQPLSTSSLLAQLDSAAQPHLKPRPLLLDTRPTGNFQEERLKGSINLAIPTLILKRWKKYLEKDSRSGHLALVQAIGDSIQGLQGFVTTEGGKAEWDRLLGTGESDASAPGLWNGDIVVYDEEMDETDPLGPTLQAPSKSPSPGPQQLLPPSSTPTTSWLLLSILSSLTSSTPPSKSPNQVYWLRGGFAAVRRDPSLRARHMTTGSTNLAELDDVNKALLPHRGGASGTMDKEPAVYTSSPTEMEAPPLPLPQNPPSSTLLALPSSSIQSPTSPSSYRQRAVSTSAIPSPSTSSNSGMFQQGGGAAASGGSTATTTTSGFKGRGGLLSLKTDVKLPRSKSKQRTQIDVGPVAEEASSSGSPVKERGGAKASSFGSSSSTSHGSVVGVSDLTPPSRNASSNESHTPTVPSHSPLPPLRKPSPIGRLTGGGGTYSYSSMYAEASPSPSPSTTTANLPFPRTPTSGSGNGGTASSSTTTSPGGGFLRNRSNTAMLPKLARLDTKTSRERLAPINTNLASTSSSNTKIAQPPPPLPPLPSTSETSSSNNNSSNTNNNTSNTTPPADQTQQPGMPPKLSLRTTPLKAATLAAPIASPKVSGFGLKLNLPPSPNRAAFPANVVSPTNDFKSPLSGTSMYFSPVQTPSEMARQYPFTPVESTYHSNTNFQYASFALPPDPPRTPGLGVPSQHYQQQPSSPTTPLTARPPPSPAMSSALTSESEGAIPPFIISTIVPGFLYLGPEMSSEENVEELTGFGVKRILNMAIECEPDDYGLDLDKRFEKYNRIGMRDTVEEDRMSKALKEVCELLDDARLHNAPTYVHCKAGKSRSVTAVMAYLIHANHWTLGQAYKYVVDRRKGVSPNIGFVSELMNFEEAKLGTKSIGVTPDLASSADVVPPPPVIPARVRAAHARDSLPPGALFHTQSVGEAMSQIGVPVTAGSLGGAAVGAGAGEEMEVKDEEGR
ncbi:hypothetical protein FRC00_007940, partial [Tulasnella sp. 408]